MENQRNNQPLTPQDAPRKLINDALKEAGAGPLTLLQMRAISAVIEQMRGMTPKGSFPLVIHFQKESDRAELTGAIRVRFPEIIIRTP